MYRAVCCHGFRAFGADAWWKVFIIHSFLSVSLFLLGPLFVDLIPMSFLFRQILAIDCRYTILFPLGIVPFLWMRNKISEFFE